MPPVPVPAQHRASVCIPEGGAGRSSGFSSTVNRCSRPWTRSFGLGCRAQTLSKLKRLSLKSLTGSKTETEEEEIQGKVTCTDDETFAAKFRELKFTIDVIAGKGTFSAR